MWTLRSQTLSTFAAQQRTSTQKLKSFKFLFLFCYTTTAVILQAIGTNFLSYLMLRWLTYGIYTFSYYRPSNITQWCDFTQLKSNPIWLHHTWTIASFTKQCRIVTKQTISQHLIWKTAHTCHFKTICLWKSFENLPNPLIW